jgi:hypothetical protein
MYGFFIRLGILSKRAGALDSGRETMVLSSMAAFILDLF